MKNKLIILGLTMLLVLGCTNYEKEVLAPQINLGEKSTSTAIKSIIQNGNKITATFETTPGAKYSVQIIPFGSETPIKKEGFTASAENTTKFFDLSDAPRMDYDFIFMDIDGKEVKFPIVVK
jgi:hypothetical protein